MTKLATIEFMEIGHIGLITLNRPEALNALSHAMIIALYKQLTAWREDEAVKAILIQGAGEKAFCAGGDIRKIYEAKHEADYPMKEFFWDEYRLNHCIYHYPKPYIALLDGITMGGGVGVSLHGSHRIATERFMFAMPETGIGFFPDIGGSYLLSRCPGQTGTYLGLTGARVKAADAFYLGLVNHCIPSNQKPELLDALFSAKLGDAHHTSISAIIEKHAVAIEPAPLAEQRHLIDECFSFNSPEEIISVLQNKSPDWCAQTVKTLLSKSPTSLKVTLQQLRQGVQMDFDQCMQMEYRLALRFLANHDFYEGVRAIIIDKDQKPQWQPATLAEVKQNEVDSYFAPLTETPELDF